MIISILVLLLQGSVFLFVLLQIIYLFGANGFQDPDALLEAMKQIPVWDFEIFFANPFTKKAFIVTLICFCIYAAIQLYPMLKFPNIKSRYDKSSYSRLLSKQERKRGTQRLFYDHKGELTTFRVECGLELLFGWILNLQNQFCNHFHLPETRKWNAPQIRFNCDTKQLEYKKVKGGIPVIAYRKYFLFGKYNRAYYLGQGTHNFFLGMTGRGKSMTFVLTMLASMIMAGEIIVVHDPKHELYAYMKPLLKKYDYETIVINFDKPSQGHGWNPLDYPYRKWKENLKEKGLSKDEYDQANMSIPDELLLDIANTIAYEEDAKQPYFWQGAAAMIAGAARLMFEEGVDEYVNFKSIKYLFQLGDDHSNGRQTSIAQYLKKYRAVDSRSGEWLSTYLESEGITKASLKSVFQNKLNLVTGTQDILEMTSHSTFDMRDVFKKKTAIFLLTQDEKSTYYPLVTMFFKQLYEVGIKITRERPEGKLPIPMNWVIDEMGLLPEIKDIEAIYGAAKSRGCCIYGFAQSPAQLRSKYGNEGAKIIFDNNENIIYLGSGEAETKEFFQQRAGTERIYDKNKNSFIDRPLVTGERLNQMEKGRSLFTTVEWNPYIAKLPQFKEFTFATKPDWNMATIEKPEVKFFNIQKELEYRKIKKIEKEGIKVVDFGGTLEVDSDGNIQQ